MVFSQRVESRCETFLKLCCDPSVVEICEISLDVELGRH